MLMLVAVAILTSVAIDGGMIVLLNRRYPRFTMEGIHWLAALVCAAVTTVCITTGAGATKGLKELNRTVEKVETYTEVLDTILGGDASDLSLSTIAKGQLSLFKANQRNNLLTTLIISIIVAIAGNILLFFFLNKTGRHVQKRRMQRSYSDVSHSSSTDNF